MSVGRDTLRRLETVAGVAVLAAAFLAGCSTVSQPRAIAEASLGVEVLLGGPLESQPATATMTAKVNKDHNRAVELDKPDGVDRQISFITGGFLFFGRDVELVMPSKVAPRLEANGPQGTGQDASLRATWKLLAANERWLNQRRWAVYVAAGYYEALEVRLEEAERRTLTDALAGKIDLAKAFTLIAEFEGKRRSSRASAAARLARLADLSAQKTRLLEELERRALGLAFAERPLSDHHLRIANLLSVEALKCRYEGYRAAFDRLRERIEKAYQEGVAESRDRRARIEGASSPIDKIKEAFK